MSPRRATLVAAVALVLSIPAMAGVRARYGGELRLLLREAAQTTDPARLRSPSDVALAGLVHAPLGRTGSPGRPELFSALEVPEAAGGRLYRFVLRPGLRFHDGSAVDSRSLIGSLERLADPQLRSPFAALALPLVGAADGARRISGLSAVGDLEVQASLAFPYPEWPLSFGHPAAGVVSVGAEPGKIAGAGPFAFGSGPGELLPFLDAAGGRPFVDRVEVSVATASAATRALAGGSTLAAMPVSTKPLREGRCGFATYLALNDERLKGRAADVRTVLEASLDRAELTRLFVRAPASPLARLLPRGVDPGTEEPKVGPRQTRPVAPLVAAVLAVDLSNPDQIAVAERIQLRLHRAGLNVEVRKLERAAHEEALGSRTYDLALVSFALLPEPGMALAQLVDFAAGRAAARDELRRIGSGATAEARRQAASARAAKLQPELPLVPLYEQCPTLVESEDVVGAAYDDVGVPRVADVWVDRLEAGGGRPEGRDPRR